MGMFDSFDISSSGMSAERYRMDIIAQNVANAETTRTAEGGPYVRKVVTYQEKQATETRSFSHVLDSQFSRVTGRPLGHLNATELTEAGYGVKIASVEEDTWTEMNKVYDPTHPDADEEGYVTYPNVSTITEMTNLIDASRAFEANATAFNASKSIATKGLEMAN
ncbi:MAG: flagellar basal body rod protein FlgC [Lachnospiraceae bacterium]|nr:flagellar basal body rod protein FlgC [Lachnospiraceae bacterium]